MKDKILTEEKIEYLAKLSKLRLGEKEKEVFSTHLDNILSILMKMSLLDTENVEFTYNENMNIYPQHFHEDVIKPSLSQDVALGMTKHRKDGFIEVPGIL